MFQFQTLLQSNSNQESVVLVQGQTCIYIHTKQNYSPDINPYCMVNSNSQGCQDHVLEKEQSSKFSPPTPFTLTTYSYWSGLTHNPVRRDGFSSQSFW